MTAIVIRPGSMRLSDWRGIYRGAAVDLDEDCRGAVQSGAAAIEAILERHEPVYGINTGFGRLASVRIDDSNLALLQRNLVLSHMAGVGDPLPETIVRLVIALKVASLAQGASGVRWTTVQQLVAFLRHGLTPVIPGQGSVAGRSSIRPCAARLPAVATV